MVCGGVCRSKLGRKAADLTDVSKPLKTEKEKKDALANIDINNYASEWIFLLGACDSSFLHSED